MSTLIEEFNNLGGNSLSEHKHKFSLYAKKICALDPADQIIILNELNVVYRQEELFLTKLALKCDHKVKIIDTLLSGDRILSRIIVNYKPLVLSDYSVDFIVGELFPNVSYIVRNKCITNLEKTIDRDDIGKEFFKAVVEKYGIKQATPLLTVCDEEFIRDTLKIYKINLKERQLVKLHQRFGLDLIDFYYSEMKTYGISCFDEQPYFARYLVLNDVKSFYSLLKYGVPKIGKRGFKNFLKMYKEDVIKNPKKYAKLVNLRILFQQSTRDEYKRYFLNSNKNRNMYEHIKYLKLLPIGERYDFIAMMAKSGNKIFDMDNKYDVEAMLHLLPVADKLKCNLSDDIKLEYERPEIVFPKIKERVNLTSDINSRCELVLKLFKSAHNNNDNKALVEALKYVLKRHKNDKSSIRQDVFDFIKNKYKLEHLSEEIWQLFYEMYITEEVLNTESYCKYDNLEEIIKCKFLRGLDCLDEFKKYVKLVGYHYFRLPTKDKTIQKWALLKLPEVAKELFTEVEALKRYPESYLKILKHWNNENPNDIISYYKYPELIEQVLEHYSGSYYDDILAHTVMIFPTTDPKERAIQDKLFDSFEKFVKYEKLWEWLLKHRFYILEKNIDLVFNKSTLINENFYYELHKLHFTRIPCILRTKALEILNNPATEQWELKKCLRILQYEKDYLQILEKNKDTFYPTGNEADIDVFQPEIEKVISVHYAVIDTLKAQTCPVNAYEQILRFCYKDYFRESLPVLTRILFNSPENRTMEPIKALADRSVTVRKRAMFFSSTICNAQTTYEALKLVGETEKNQSLQKFIFNRTYKAFRNIQNQQMFDLLIQHFKFAFEADHETRQMVFTFNEIPKRFLGDYVHKIWNHIGKQWENGHTEVLNAISANVMPYIKDDLCDEIIQFNLANSKGRLQSSDIDFIYRYLMSGGDKLDYRFNIVVKNTAAKFAGEEAQTAFKEANVNRHNLAFLYDDLLRRTIADSQLHKGDKLLLINKFINSLPDLMVPYNAGDFKCALQMSKCFFENEAALPDFVIQLQKEAIAKYGDVVIMHFNNVVVNNLDMYGSLLKNESYAMNFAWALLEKENTIPLKLLAISLMPNFYPDDESDRTWQFCNLIERIQADNEPLVTLYLNYYLKKHNM